MKRQAIALSGALLSLFLIDAAIFRSGLYSRVLDPESTAGRVETMHYLEVHRKRSQAAQVLAFGDSRMGFLPRVATEAAAGRAVEFASVAVPGTSPRSWYYQLRDLDPDARRYAAILLPVDDYDDEDRLLDPTDSVVDLNYAIGRMRLADLFDFAGSFPSWRSRWIAFRGGLFQGCVYKDDLHALLAAPRDRIRKARRSREDSADWYQNFEASDRDINGVAVDWTRGTLTVPPGTTALQERVLRNVLLRQVAAQTGRLASYRREWFGRMIDRYRGAPVHVIFFRLPRGPIPRPDWLVRRRSSSVRELAARPNVVLLDEHIFEPLERTSYFMDPLHLNRRGMTEFSRMLGESVSARLAPAAPAN